MIELAGDVTMAPACPADNLRALVAAADRVVARLALRAAEADAKRSKAFRAPICEREGCGKSLPAIACPRGSRIRHRERSRDIVNVELPRHAGKTAPDCGR